MNQHEPIFFTVPSGNTKKPRRLYKGGGGGDGGAADRKAAEDARVAAAIQQVNSVFGIGNAVPETVDKAAFTKTVNAPTSTGLGSGGFWGGNNQGSVKPTTTSFDQVGYDAAVAAAKAKADALTNAASTREQLYTKIGDDTKNTALIDLNKERGITERDLNFGLARQGLSGGSRDIDANKDVLDTYNQGVVKAANMGLSTANNARSSDDTTRVNLINSIRAGLDQGSAMQQSYQGLANNAKAAADDANSASLGGFFDSLRAMQQQQQYQQGVQSVATPLKTTATTGAGKSYSGTTRSY